MTTPLKNPVDEVLPIIGAAFAEWLHVNDPKTLHDSVMHQLEEAKKQILLKLLGFDQDWAGRNRWELDHCNGRAGESAAGDYLRKNMQPCIDEFLATVTMPEISKKELAQLTASCKDEYLVFFKRALKETIRIRAQQDADAFVKTLVKPTLMEGYLKMQELLQVTYPEAPKA